MTDVLSGIRVVELAAWTFVPAAGAVLADWGADVIKIEHPETGDPQRGLINSGIVAGAGGVNHFIEQPNRGKRSIGLDTSSPEGLGLLMTLIETADVFLANLLRTRGGAWESTWTRCVRVTPRSSMPAAMGTAVREKKPRGVDTTSRRIGLAEGSAWGMPPAMAPTRRFSCRRLVTCTAA